jgi:menaquinone-dependent protoporphyrinogen oxidase
VDGHTREICERLRPTLEAAGLEVALDELAAGSSPELSGFDAVVVGASIRYGKHRPEVTAFIEAQYDYLASTPSAFFSVNAVARKPAKKTPDTNPYVRKFLGQISWQPQLIGIFAGKIDYPSYSFFDKHMIRFIMWMTKGPTDLDGTFEFTDWDDVDAFARRVADKLVASGAR